MKRNISEKVADLALAITKSNVNTNCWAYFHQPKLPKDHEKLRNKNL